MFLFLLASGDHRNMCNHRTSTTVVFLSPRYRFDFHIAALPPPMPPPPPPPPPRCVQLQRQMRRRRGRKRKWENKICSKFPIMFITKKLVPAIFSISFGQYHVFTFDSSNNSNRIAIQRPPTLNQKKVIFPSFLLLSFFKGAF